MNAEDLKNRWDVIQLSFMASFESIDDFTRTAVVARKSSSVRMKSLTDAHSIKYSITYSA